MDEQAGTVNDWFRRPFQRFIKQRDETQVTLEIATAGIRVLVGLPNVLVGLTEDGEPVLSNEEAELLRQQARYAQDQVDREFPFLHGQALVALWGLMEATIHDLVVAFLANDPKAYELEHVSRLRVRLGEYETLDSLEKCEYVAVQLESEVGSAFKQGATRFESILSCVGLGGEVEPQMGRDLFEMQQVRNLIVHRLSLADKRFKEACPWFNVEIGEPVNISYDRFMDYWTSLTRYAAALVRRANAHYGFVAGGTVEEAAEAARSSRVGRYFIPKQPTN